ncbi:MAG: J domain-containing protein [Spirochaetota bacterium]
MNTLTLEESYRLLNIAPGQSDDEIAKSYRALAHRYHPDKNRDNAEWATKVMSRINSAYSVVMSSRFRTDAPPPQPEQQKGEDEELRFEEMLRRQKEFQRQRVEEVIKEASINQFIRIRETAKEALYSYFQYSLHNLPRRDMPQNRSIYNGIVIRLKKTYHSIQELLKTTKDPEVTQHLTVFAEMVYNFYRAAECLTFPDSYENQSDIEAFRVYRTGDDQLHEAHWEIFYERHNRGSFRMALALDKAREARRIFKNALDRYPDSTWAMEAAIKFEYTESLIRYLALFFNED